MEIQQSRRFTPRRRNEREGRNWTPVWLLGFVLAALVAGFVLFMRGVLTGRGSFWGAQTVVADSGMTDSAGRPVFPGVVVGSIAAGVGATFSGRVSEVRVERGQRVQRGDVLFVMETDKLEQDLEEAAAAAQVQYDEVLEARRARDADSLLYRRDLAAAEALEGQERAALHAAWASIRELREGRRRLSGRRIRFAADDARRAERRLERVKLATAEARQAVSTSEARWDSALLESTSSLARARAQVREVKGALAAAVRASPISGVVSRVAVNPGDQVAARQPVVRVDRLSGILAVALIPADHAAGLREGARAKILHQSKLVEAELTETRDGEDRNLFQKLAYFAPEDASSLLPGDSIEVLLTR